MPTNGISHSLKVNVGLPFGGKDLPIYTLDYAFHAYKPIAHWPGDASRTFVWATRLNLGLGGVWSFVRWAPILQKLLCWWHGLCAWFCCELIGATYASDDKNT